MSQENVDIIRHGYELYTQGNIDAVAELFTEDAEIADAGGLGIAGTAAGVRHGPEGFRRVVEETMDVFEDFEVETEEFLDTGDAVVVPVRITGRGKASGAQMEMRLVHLWVLRDGKAIRGEVHRTVDEALAAAVRT